MEYPAPPPVRPPVPDSLIPSPDVVLNRLARLRIEARFLARLLRLSEDYARALPARAPAPTPADGNVSVREPL